MPLREGAEAGGGWANVRGKRVLSSALRALRLATLGQLPAELPGGEELLVARGDDTRTPDFFGELLCTMQGASGQERHVMQ